MGGSTFIGEEVAVYTDSLDSFVLGAASGEESDIRVDDAQNNQLFDPTSDNPLDFSHEGILRFRPLDNANANDQDNRVQLNFTNTSSFTTIIHRDGRAGGFVLDANFTTAPFDESVIVDTNTEFDNIFTEGDAPIAITADTISINDELNSIGSATIEITNAEASDLIAVTGTLPAGITATINSDTSITLTGVATADAYEQAILAITFENTSNQPNDTTIREIDITVTDDDSLASNTATSFIQVIDLPNEAPTIDLDFVGDINAVPGSDGFTSLTFTGPQAIGLDGQTEAVNGQGQFAIYRNVGLVDGQSIDIIATVVRLVDDPTEFPSVTADDGEDSPVLNVNCLLYTSPSPRDRQKSRMPSSA